MRRISLIVVVSILLAFTFIVDVYIFYFINGSLDSSAYEWEALQQQNIISISDKNVKVRKEFEKRDSATTSRNLILPKHVILVTGLESSGTKYMSTAIALVTAAIKEGRSWDIKYTHDRIGGIQTPNQVEVLHHSLPNGGWCTYFGKQLENITSRNLTKVFESWTIPFIPPIQCSCNAKEWDRFPMPHGRFDEDEEWNMRRHGRRKNENETKLMGDKEHSDMWMERRSKHEHFLEALHLEHNLKKRKHKNNKAHLGSEDNEEIDHILMHSFHEEDSNRKAMFIPSDENCDTWNTINAVNGPKSQERCLTLGINKPIESPLRNFINISSHVKWYQEQGVRATAVIVIREQNIESISKYNDHCKNKHIAKAENDYGKRFIQDAFDNLSQDGPTPSLVLVSFETLVMFGESYLRTQIYPKLGINKDNYTFVPPIHDSNKPYILKNYTKAEHNIKKFRASAKKCEDKNNTKIQNDTKPQKMKYYKGNCITYIQYEKYQKIILRDHTERVRCYDKNKVKIQNDTAPQKMKYYQGKCITYVEYKEKKRKKREERVENTK